MAYTYLPSGYDINMGGAPAGGATLGQLLMPNYLGGRPWEENGAGPIMLDPDDIEGSFKARTGVDLRTAIAELAPGLRLPGGTITKDFLETRRVDPTTEQRAPAKGGFEDVLLPAIAGLVTGGIGAWAAGGGALSGLNAASGMTEAGWGMGAGGLGGDAASLAAGASGAGTGGAMDWFDLPSYADSGGWESWLPDAANGYNPVSANDPIGELIRQLDSGVSSADALKAVEASLPGTTRSALEQFLFEAGSNASNLLKNGASKLFGGGDTDSASFLSKLLSGAGSAFGNNPALTIAMLAGLAENTKSPLEGKLIDAANNLGGEAIPMKADYKPMLDKAGAFADAGGGDLDINKYMNPYLDSVLPGVERASEKTKIAQRAGAARVGAFGGTRMAVEDSLADRNLLETTAKVKGAGFDSAAGLAKDQRARQLTASGAFNSQANTEITGNRSAHVNAAGDVEALTKAVTATLPKSKLTQMAGAFGLLNKP